MPGGDCVQPRPSFIMASSKVTLSRCDWTMLVGAVSKTYIIPAGLNPYFLWLPDLLQWLHHHGSVVQPTHTDRFLHRFKQQEMVGLLQWICNVCTTMDGRQLPSCTSDVPHLRSHQKWSERNWEVSIETCLATREERYCGLWWVICNWSLLGNGDILDRQHATHVLQCLPWTGMSGNMLYFRQYFGWCSNN